MIARLLVVLLLVAVLVPAFLPTGPLHSVSGLPHPIAHLRAASSTLAQSVLVSTQGTAKFATSVTATQTGGSPFGCAAATVNLAFPLVSAANVSGYTLSMTGQGSSSLNPQANGTQGSTIVFNATLVSQIIVYPNPAAVAVKTISLWTTAGATPSPGTYKVYYNGTQTVLYSFAATATWTFNGTGYTFAYILTPPSGVSFNQTQVFVPFPANVSVNFTSLQEKFGNTKIAPIQATNLGVYLYPFGVAAGGTENLTITFTPAPSTSGFVPVLVFSKFTTNPNGSDTSTSSYVNGRTAAYAGIYILQLRFPQPISVSSLQIRFAKVLLPNTSYSVSGSTITVLPFAYATPAAGNVTVTLLFVFGSGVPSLSIGRSTVLFPLGSVQVTVLELTVTALAATAFLDFVVWFYFGDYKPKRSYTPQTPFGVAISKRARGLVVALSGFAFVLMAITLLLVFRTT